MPISMMLILGIIVIAVVAIFVYGATHDSK